MITLSKGGLVCLVVCLSICPTRELVSQSISLNTNGFSRRFKLALCTYGLLNKNIANHPSMAHFYLKKEGKIFSLQLLAILIIY